MLLRKRKLSKTENNEANEFLSKASNNKFIKIEVKLDIKDEPLFKCGLKQRRKIKPEDTMFSVNSKDQFYKGVHEAFTEIKSDKKLSRITRNGSISIIKNDFSMDQLGNFQDEISQKRNINDNCSKCDNYEKFKCEFCNKVFVNKKKYEVHHRMHIKKRQFSCGSCSESFQYLLHLARHISIIHKKLDPLRTECPICFKIVSAIKAHLRTHQNCPMNCGICGATMKNYSNYKSHLRYHNMLSKEGRDRAVVPKHYIGKRTKHQCVICEKLFQRKADLLLHIKSHVDLCLYSCPRCDNSAFNTPQELTKHNSRVHRSIARPYTQCGDCGKTVRDINTHYKEHSVILIQCQYCPLTFSSEKEYSKHYKLKHEPSEKHFIKVFMDKYSSRWINHRKVPCFHCRVSIRVSHMPKHMASHRTFRCVHCDKMMWSVESLAVHRTIHEATSGDSCPVCGRSFLSHVRLIAHLKSSHLLATVRSRRCSFC